MPRVNFYDGPIDSLDASVVLDAISTQICPWCGRGGFVSLSGHTSHAHGVSQRQLKDMAGLLYTTPACIPEYAISQSDKAKASAANRVKHFDRIRYATRGCVKQFSVVAKKRMHLNLGKPNTEAKIAARRRVGVFAASPNGWLPATWEKNRGKFRFKHGTQYGFYVRKCDCSSCVEAAENRRCKDRERRRINKTQQA